MSSGNNTARSTARSTPLATTTTAKKKSKSGRASTPGGVAKKRVSSGSGGDSGRRRSLQKRAVEVFGEDPGELYDGLVGRIGGGILDCTDALEVSAHENGVSEEAACEAIKGVLEAVRGDLAPRLAAFRAYALRNVFKLPPTAISDEERLDKQLRLCAARLHEARTRTREIEKAKKAIQHRITTLEDNVSALRTTQLRECEKMGGKNIAKLAADVMRDVNDILPPNERLPPAEIDQRQEEDDTGNLLLPQPARNGALPVISAAFEAQDDTRHDTYPTEASDDADDSSDEGVSSALALLQVCVQKAK